MTAVLTVDNRLRLKLADLGEECAAELRERFEHKNPSLGAKRAMGIPTWGEPAKYVTWEEAGGELTLPRGGLSRARLVLDKHRVAFRVADERSRGEAIRPAERLEHSVRLRGYQQRALDAALAKQNCVVRAPTGSGKTTMGLALVAAWGAPGLVVVPTAAIFNQWLDRCVAEYGIARREVGVIRGPTRKLRPITIAMQRSLALAPLDDEEQAYFGGVICDEVQQFAAKTFFGAVDHVRAKHRVGISADERRKDKKEFLIADVFGGIAADIPKADVLAEKGIVEVSVRVVPTDFRADWYGMPVKGAEANEEKFIDMQRLLEEATKDVARNALALVALDEEPGAQMLVFSHRREHVLLLDSMFAACGARSGFMVGGDEAQFEATKRGLKEGTLRVGVGTYQAMGTGVDIPAIAVGVATTPIAGNRQFFGQVCGRLSRPGKDRAVLYYLWDRHVFGVKHLQNIARWNSDTTVLDGGAWVPAREWLRRMRAA